MSEEAIRHAVRRQTKPGASSALVRSSPADEEQTRRALWQMQNAVNIAKRAGETPVRIEMTRELLGALKASEFCSKQIDLPRGTNRYTRIAGVPILVTATPTDNQMRWSVVSEVHRSDDR